MALHPSARIPAVPYDENELQTSDHYRVLTPLLFSDARAGEGVVVATPRTDPPCAFGEFLRFVVTRESVPVLHQPAEAGTPRLAAPV